METIRLCLKHFRQKNMMDVYSNLQKTTSIELEHPLIEKLHQSAVVDGDFEAAEKIILDADEKSIFKSYVENAKYLPTWQRISAFNDGKYHLHVQSLSINNCETKKMAMLHVDEAVINFV